jgi:protease-4
MHRLVAASLALLLAGAGAARAGGSEGGLPDYFGDVDFLVDAPGASSSVAAGMFNPAAWGIQRTGGFFFAWDDAAGDLDRRDITGVLSLRHLGFGVRHFELEPTAGDPFQLRDYVFGVASGDRGHAWGLSYAWGGGDLHRRKRHERLMAGSVTRCRFASLGVASTWDLKKRDNLLQADLGFRPFGPRLTLFGDAVYEHGQAFEDIRSGYGLELRPIPGLALGVRGRSDGEFAVRVSLALNRNSWLGLRTRHADGGDRLGTAYTFEAGGAHAALGHGVVGRGRRFPELDLRGRMAYQRFRLFDRRRTLLGTLRHIESPAADPQVGGMVVNLSGAQIGPEMLWEIREQLAGLRARGKKVVVYLDRGTIWHTMLASVADEVWIDPLGGLEVMGLAVGRTYMRRALDKLGLGVDEWRFFTYKSAFEGYSRQSMSEPDREQRQALVDDFYDALATAVTSGRGISRAQWDEIVNERGMLLPEEARAAGLVDSIGSFADAKKAARRAARRGGEPAAAALGGVAGDPVWGREEWGERRRIAVLYAIGPCDMDTGIRGRVLSKAIQEAGANRRVAAIVLRADSPGGDALPSDLVARAMLEAAKKKPVVVSQGQVAASGGYWISMNADTIVAAPLTITGSIGVIGGWVWNKNLGDKIGFDYDGVKHGDHADLAQGIVLPFVNEVVPDRPLTAEERDRVEMLIRDLYQDFVGKVAQGRGLDKETVDGIGQGRVWSGTRGRDNGLVDEIGGLWRTLQIAKAAAGLAPGRDVEFLEGPSPGLLDASFLRPRLLGARGAAALAAAERQTLAPPSEAQIDYLRRLLQARGRPLVLMEPFELEPGEPRR